MKRISFAVSLVAAIACDEPATAPPPFAPVISARELWSGGELRVLEPWFRNADAIVILGTDTLTADRVNDTTFAVRLPRYSGTFPIRIVAGQLAASLGNVTLRGFVRSAFGPIMSGQPYWIPGSGAPLVFAGANEGAAMFDLRTGTPTMSLPDSLSSPDCIWSPSPTYRTDRFVLMGKKADGSCGFPKLWSLTTPPQLLDSIACCAAAWYTSGQPSARRWIFNRNNRINFYICDSSCVGTSFLSGDGPNGVTISPRADRFLWLPAWAPVVFDARTLDTAFVLGGFFSVGSRFSFEGDTLVVTALDTTSQHRTHLMAVRSSDGALLRDIVLDSVIPEPGLSYWSAAIAFDPVNPWLYLVATSFTPPDTLNRQHLIVVDRRSWSILGVLDAGEPNLGLYSVVTVVPSPVERRVYVVSTVNGDRMHGYRSIIVTYSTP